MTDPISDMLIRIKNAQKAGKETVAIPYSRFKDEIAVALQRAGFLGGVDRKGKKSRKCLQVRLLYKNGESAVTMVRLFSKPSRRVYASYRSVHTSQRGGTIIMSTPKGVLSVSEAKKAKVGGQLIAEIW